jgi:hypothetical protein
LTVAEKTQVVGEDLGTDEMVLGVFLIIGMVRENYLFLVSTPRTFNRESSYLILSKYICIVHMDFYVFPHNNIIIISFLA